MEKNRHRRNGSSNGTGGPERAGLCVILREPNRRGLIAEALRCVGFCVHEFSCGAAFLLSENARTCEGLVAEYQLTGLTLPTLMDALIAAELVLPIVALLCPSEEDDGSFAGDQPLQVVRADATTDEVVQAMRAVLARRTR